MVEKNCEQSNLNKAKPKENRTNKRQQRQETKIQYRTYEQETYNKA